MKNMAIETVRDYLITHGIHEKILEFPVSSATVELAAQALGCEEIRIAKALAFEVNGNPLLVIAAGDARIDNGKFRACFGGKPKMLDAGQVVAATGHEVGGVCPSRFLMASPSSSTTRCSESRPCFRPVAAATARLNSHWMNWNELP